MVQGTPHTCPASASLRSCGGGVGGVHKATTTFITILTSYLLCLFSINKSVQEAGICSISLVYWLKHGLSIDLHSALIFAFLLNNVEEKFSKCCSQICKVPQSLPGSLWYQTVFTILRIVSKRLTFAVMVTKVMVDVWIECLCPSKIPMFIS